MSFEIKYDRDGNVIKAQEPVFQEVAPGASIEEVEVEAAAEEPEMAAVEEEAPESSEPVLQTAADTGATSNRAPNESWKALRDQKERAERENRELREALQAASRKQEPQEDLDFAIDEDALAEGKHLNKVQKKLKAMESKIKQYEQQSHISNVRSSLRNQFPDFDKVLTQENLDRLNETEPEIAHSLNSTQDPYAAGVSAYKMIKKMGIYEDKQVYNPNAQAVAKNASKPRPVASLKLQGGDSPLTHANAFANGLTDELKEQMIREMNAARKGY